MMMSFNSTDDLGVFLDPSVSLSSMDLLNNLEAFADPPRGSVAAASSSSSSSLAVENTNTIQTAEPRTFPWATNAPAATTVPPTLPAAPTSASSFSLGFTVDSSDSLFGSRHGAAVPVPSVPVPVPPSVLTAPPPVVLAPAAKPAPVVVVPQRSHREVEETIPRNSSIENFW
jgi:hypothetical protein